MAPRRCDQHGRSNHQGTEIVVSSKPSAAYFATGQRSEYAHYYITYVNSDLRRCSLHRARCVQYFRARHACTGPGCRIAVIPAARYEDHRPECPYENDRGRLTHALSSRVTNQPGRRRGGLQQGPYMYGKPCRDFVTILS